MTDEADAMRSGFWDSAPASYWLTRFVFLRAIGFIYVVAFSILCNQMLPLFGSDGLEPAAPYVADMRSGSSFFHQPTLFWWNTSDSLLSASAWLGMALSLLVLCGLDNACVLALLWALYMSFVHVGQDFYGYGWEILLLEAGFLSIFLCSPSGLSTLRDAQALPPPRVVIWLVRWLVFRVMLGAGLIKIRGDACWRDLTCLIYHYETQPNPHPLSYLLFAAPPWFHKLGVLFNHLVELVAPWFVFGPRLARHIAGALIVAFQIILISSGNLAFLNWLTLAIALPCFDDSLWEKLLPARLVHAAHARAQQAKPSKPQRIVTGVLAAVVCLLSYAPIANLLSPHQRMNTSFDPIHLVNSYGAFGSIGKQRDEVILQGTSDARPSAHAHWLEYEFKCKPGDIHRRPCLITPYHLRLDWQMWFAALSDYRREPWILNLIYKLLQGNQATLSLMDKNPFPDKPPTFIRAERYRYKFTRPGSPDWWQRERLDSYLPPLSKDNEDLQQFLAQQGWLSVRNVTLQP